MLGKRKKFKSARIDSLVGHQTEMHGDIKFTGGLHVDGVIRGNVFADDGSDSLLTK